MAVTETVFISKHMSLYLYNTLTRQKQKFIPQTKGKVSLYTCGPTVYNFAHIGNLRTYVFEDILKRTLLYLGYQVKHVMNITDVGHLTSDADEGEDKLEKGARREQKSVWEIAEFYTKKFKEDLQSLNILLPDVWAKATDYIDQQIKLIQTLETKGFTYLTTDGIYFDTSKFPQYAQLAKLDIAGLQEGARIGKNIQKKNITDFALWKFSPQNAQRAMEWDSPWGKGFPGWHIECSAMSMALLGQTIDIHCGGIDHIPTHHTNERAQSIAATDKPFAKFWMHGGHLTIGKRDDKMAKSDKNFLTLNKLTQQNISPSAYRYFLFSAHYRTNLNFSREAINGAQKAFDKLQKEYYKLGQPLKTQPDSFYHKKFKSILEDDLNMPQTIALVWELLKDNRPNKATKKSTLDDFDKVLGLNLNQYTPPAIPAETLSLAKERQTARKKQNWTKADQLRNQINGQGYEIEDLPDNNFIITK